MACQCPRPPPGVQLLLQAIFELISSRLCASTRGVLGCRWAGLLLSATLISMCSSLSVAHWLLLILYSNNLCVTGWEHNPHAKSQLVKGQTIAISAPEKGALGQLLSIGRAQQMLGFASKLQISVSSHLKMIQMTSESCILHNLLKGLTQMR